MIVEKMVEPRPAAQYFMKGALLSAVTVVAFATTGNASEFSEIEARAKQLREQNRVLTERLADLEKRQRKLEAKTARQAEAATRPAHPAGSMAADYGAYKTPVKKASVSDGLTWNGITLYGQIDAGVTYQDHGVPLNNSSASGLNYVVSKNSNRSYFGISGNALSSSFVGLKGDVALTDGLSAVFNLQTGFNPWSGRLQDGIGSVAQNNGLPVSAQNAFSDSSKAGQAFNLAAYGGLSSPTYGTLTYGRQNALTSDGVANYDPLTSSGAFSLIGYQGATGGGGVTENRILDNSFKYAVEIGPFRAKVETQLSAGGNSAPRNVIQGQVGGDYAGLSLDAIFSHVQDAVTAAPLTAAQVLSVNGLGISPGSGFISATVADTTSAMLLAKYVIGPVKLFGGYEHIQFANPGTPLVPGNFLEGGYAIGVVNNTAFATDKTLQVFWGGIRYAVRPDVDLAAAYYHEVQNSFQGGTPATLNAGHCADASLAQCSGQLNAVSLLATYRFAKQFDAYAGIMWSHVSNGLASGFLQRSSIDPTVGLRFQF